MRTRFKLIALGGLLLSLLVLFRRCGGLHAPIPAPSAPLPVNDSAKVSIENQMLTVQTPQGTTTKYVPNDVMVEIQKNGNVIAHVQEIGLEKRPYVGISGGDTPRLQLGLQMAYLQKGSFGLGVGFAIDRDVSLVDFVRLNVNVGYVVYRNTSVFIGIDHTGEYLCGLQIKL